MAHNQVDAFINSYSESISNRSAAVFAGAGLSIPAGFVDWRGLLRGIAKDIGLDVDREHDLVTLAQYHVNEHGSRNKINEALINQFSDKSRLTRNHEILASLPIRTYWTTNYDSLLERALREAGKTPDVKVSQSDLATVPHRRDAVVYKMHGDSSQPHDAVVTKEDYELYGTNRQLFSMALQGDLVSKTFLFLGFSFSDPNLSYVLGRIRVLLGQNQRNHYCLLKRPKRGDYTSSRTYQYAKVKHELQIRDLRRYGILAVVVDSYGGIETILEAVSRRYRRGRVFISGSAARYAPWSEGDAQRLISEITRRLVRDEFAVISGSGQGVSEHVVNGAIDQIESEGTRVIDDRLTVRPFPRRVGDPIKRAELWTRYRRQILQEAGIALFLFGNKLDASGKLIDADGVVEEFDLAVDQNLRVVPIGCTGSAAKALYERVQAKVEAFYPTGCKGLVASLGRLGTATKVADRVLKLVRKLRDVS
jgi:hypothetical protein